MKQNVDQIVESARQEFFQMLRTNDDFRKVVAAAIQQATEGLQKECDELRGRCDLLRAQLEAMDEARQHDEVQCDQLRAELAACKEDSRRLDWFQENGSEGLTIGGICYWSIETARFREQPKRLSEGESLREAIDAAMEQPTP